MELADLEGHASRKYFKLQRALVSIETQKHAIGRLTASTGALDPHPSVRERWFDPALFLSVDLSPHIRKLRASAKSHIRSIRPPLKLGVVVPVTDAEKLKKLEDEAAAKLETERLNLFQHIEQNGGASNIDNKEQVARLKEITESKADNVHHNPDGGRIGGAGIPVPKPDEKRQLNPISPYHRHLTRQSLRSSQRFYREHERLRPCSKVEISLIRDLPSAGQDLHHIFDCDVNQFIDIARSAGALTYQPDPIYPLEVNQKGGAVASSSSRPSTSVGGLGGTKRGQGKFGGKPEDPGKPKLRRCASIAGPENMYRRICCLRPAMKRNLKVKRSFSFDKNSAVVKGLTEEDGRLIASLGGRTITDGVRNSVSLMKRALLPKDLTPNPLAAKNILPKSKAGVFLSKRKEKSHMLVPIIPLQACVEVRPLLERVGDRLASQVLGGLGERQGDVFDAVRAT
mmetsp:Transcript_15480/g.20083  ORF Transcript_15480/g.20083 Transcript_15480/m.20083 type:complete len:456 (+) Transcript_15480:44-1411(+)